MKDYCCCESYFSLMHLFLYWTLRKAKIFLETPHLLLLPHISHAWSNPVLSFEPFRLEAVGQTFKLLFPQLDLVLKLSLLNDEGRFHFHKVLIVC